MSKKFNKTQAFNGTVHEVSTMFQSEFFYEFLSKESLHYDVQIIFESDKCTVDLTQTFDLRDNVPSLVRKIVGNELTLNRTYVWMPDPTDSKSVQIELAVKSLKATGTITGNLVDIDSGSQLNLSGVIKSSLPIVSGKIEGYAMDYIDGALKKEQKIANEWLDAQR